MAIYEFAPGSTGRSINLKLRDALTAQSKSGLTASSGAISYTRHQNTPTSIALVALAAANDPWTAGGFIEIPGGAAPEYRLDVPNAGFAAGVPFVTFNTSFPGTFDEAVLVLLRNPVSNVGAGSSSYIATVQKADTTPIAGAQVWVSTDEAGTNVIAGALTTNASGQVTFLLDPGSAYLWVQDEGYNGTNPTPITVT